MEESFACPECGTPVEVRGIAPGRQVRCGFCRRLLEVPYLPRVAASPWRRRRFTRPRWVPWAWSVLGVVACVMLVAGVVRSWKRHRESAQEASIGKLIESSRRSEASGRLDQALIDLDAALVLARQAGPGPRAQVEEQGRRRRDLALRDAQSVLDRLCGNDPARASLPLGDWLNLIARARQDPDLATLQPRIHEQFADMVGRRGDTELSLARGAFQSGQVVESLEACDRIAKLLPHLRPEGRQALRGEVEELVARLVATHGVVLRSPRGDFVFGSDSSYLATLLPALVQALESKGYLPDHTGSPWRALWNQAPYQINLEVSERLEGNYLGTENRLTRIETRLTMTKGGRLIWQTNPTARTMVPLPKLPALLSSRLAASSQRSEDLERLMYEDARGQMDGKFGHALNYLPLWPGSQGR